MQNRREAASRASDRPFLTPVAWSPDGERRAYAAITDAAASREIFIVTVADGRIYT